MKRTNGPTKKLAPSIAPDTCCPHSYSDNEGVQLEVECTECAGAHDLENSKCLSGILNVMVAGAEPESIILKRYIHKRYRGEVVRQVAFAASELARLNRALAAVDPPSDKKCRTCSASTERIVHALKQRLLENPFGYATSKNAVIKDIEAVALTHACESAGACVTKALRTSSLGRG